MIFSGIQHRFGSWNSGCQGRKRAGPFLGRATFWPQVRAQRYIVTKAIPNGFSFTVSALASNATFKTYQLTVVDPSVATLGAASYAWTFTDYGGTTNTATGSVVQYAAHIDEPFTISSTRPRASQTDTLTLRERRNDLNRSGGHAVVRNLVP